MAPKGETIRWREVSGEFPDHRNQRPTPDRYWVFPTKADALLALAQSGRPEKLKVFKVELRGAP